jgi:hypothetical protein
MQSSRKHIHMYCVIQYHRHIDTSSMKTITYIHENILNITKQWYACSCIFLFLSGTYPKGLKKDIPFVYTYSTFWGSPWGSESSQLTLYKDSFFTMLFRFSLQHRGLALTDSFVYTMLEARIDSYHVLCIYLTYMLMLHAQTL